jgi:hypothetical protein
VNVFASLMVISREESKRPEKKLYQYHFLHRNSHVHWLAIQRMSARLESEVGHGRGDRMMIWCGLEWTGEISI